VDYRKRMDAWFVGQLLAGNGIPERPVTWDMDVKDAVDNDEYYVRDDVGKTR
jgi:hypothetical protein